MARPAPSRAFPAAAVKGQNDTVRKIENEEKKRSAALDTVCGIARSTRT
jgi:hypothetical protein